MIIGALRKKAARQSTSRIARPRKFTPLSIINIVASVVSFLNLLLSSESKRPTRRQRQSPSIRHGSLRFRTRAFPNQNTDFPNDRPTQAFRLSLPHKSSGSMTVATRSGRRIFEYELPSSPKTPMRLSRSPCRMTNEVPLGSSRTWTWQIPERAFSSNQGPSRFCKWAIRCGVGGRNFREWLWENATSERFA